MYNHHLNSQFNVSDIRATQTYAWLGLQISEPSRTTVRTVFYELHFVGKKIILAIGLDKNAQKFVVFKYYFLL